MGTFDGVHLGHQAILRRTAALARRRRLPSLAVTFLRPPRLFFAPQKGPHLLTLPPEKEALLKSFGIRHVEALRFGKSLASLSAERFFQRHFLRRYNAREIVVGYNFAFGKGREGDVDFLRARGRALGIPVHVVGPVSLRGRAVSSGQVRDHLRAGELEAANRKLGYPYFLSGRVVRGAGLGRRLGFPTANLKVPGDKLAPPGVFAVKAALPDGRVRRGMCNVGVRPTLKRPSLEPAVEVHLLDFSGRLVGKRLRLEFIKKIRNERKFPSLRRLAAQLRRDERSARRALG